MLSIYGTEVASRYALSSSSLSSLRDHVVTCSHLAHDSESAVRSSFLAMRRIMIKLHPGIRNKSGYQIV